MHIPMRKSLRKRLLQPLEITQGAGQFVIARLHAAGAVRHCRTQTNAPIGIQQQWSNVLAQQVEADDGAEPSSGVESRVSNYSFETLLRVRRVRNDLHDRPPAAAAACRTWSLGWSRQWATLGAA